jgi:gas vesicle protein
MADAPLRSYEQDVERARAKLASDLATLRSPGTMSSFARELKHEALDAKDAVIEGAKSSVQSTVSGVVEDLKAKAAANPAAALAIGAGVAWRLIQNPPIATALVGLGLYSLLRTDAARPSYGVQPDYVAQGRERLKEQVADVAASAKSAAAQAGEAASAKASELADLAKDKASEWADNALQIAKDVGASVGMSASSMADSAAATARRLQQEAQEAAENAYVQAGGVMNHVTAAGQAAVAKPESRDTLLLGVAGLAVAAALGIACQKRMTESTQPG